MIDYSITITDEDGDSVMLSHYFDSSRPLMLEATALRVCEGEPNSLETVTVALTMAHIRALIRFLNMVYGNHRVTKNEMEEAND
jgi:hypothetical protein